MKNMLRLIFIGTILLFAIRDCRNYRNTKANVMVVAGGHSFDTTEFVEMLRSFSDYHVDTIMQPKANQMIANGEVDTYDVLVFYDMWSAINKREKAGFHRLLDNGMGIVFLHHSIASYQDWNEYTEIVGGKYHESGSTDDSTMYSTFMHDLDLYVKCSKTDHPVIRNIPDFNIHDEGYGNLEIKKDIRVLLTTMHPECSDTIGWVNTYKNSSIVYLMPGHDKQAYSNEQYRNLIKNAIAFVRKTD